MIKQIILIGCVVWGLVGLGSEQDLKKKYLSYFMEETHARNDYTNSDWYANACFVDLNQDGLIETLITSPCESMMVLGIRSDGSFKRLPKIQFKGRPQGRPFLDVELIRKDVFYLCRLSGVSPLLVGLNVGIHKYGPLDGHVSSYSQTNAVIGLDLEGNFKLHNLVHGIDDLTINQGFMYIYRDVFDRYEGFDLKHVNVNTNFWQIVPPAHKALYGGARKPLGFDMFVRRYCANVTRRVGATRPVVVKVVFLDADNDGQTDFYVTSDAEREGAENFRWHLYLNRKGEFSPAVGRVWINRDVRYLVGVLDPVVVAPMNSFFRVALYACDHEYRLYFKPVFLVVDNVKGEMVNRAYRDLVPMEIQAKRPVVRNGQDRDGWRRFDRWKDEAEKKLGFVPPPRTLTDFVKEAVFYRLERLPCLEFHEDH